MDAKQRYRDFCRTEETIPVFSTDWWMDAVCGEDNWDVLLVEKGGEVFGSMPYYLEQVRKIRSIVMPPLTQTNGVWIRYPDGQKYIRRICFENEIMGNIIDQLDSLGIDDFNQNFHYSITNWLPFYWRGFEQTTKYTYIISDLSDIYEVFLNFDRNKRKYLRRAENIVDVKFDLPVEEFYSHLEDTFRKRGGKFKYSFELIKNIYNAVYKHDSGRVIYAVDGYGNIHAAQMVIWDKMSSYYLINSIDPDFKQNGTNTLLVGEFMKYIADKNLKYDFEGSMIKSVENYYRKLGGIQTPYFNISKKYKPDNLVHIIMKDIYRNSPGLKRAYDGLRGKL